MVEGDPDVTLETLHGDLGELRGEMRVGFADLKVTRIDALIRGRNNGEPPA